ncbi:hypothetical protein L1987_07176 [Smallanthus sonchifolius]|uniref:Uncharacterized protein n=1 Tax=Smallanthus sonchifolius TaxID=185202 RepID=A0ACB9K083_9ASTR|nr:hypothetical protein L1987_07176 [Smallanthus sonchifolius]
MLWSLPSVRLKLRWNEELDSVVRDALIWATVDHGDKLEMKGEYDQPVMAMPRTHTNHQEVEKFVRILMALCRAVNYIHRVVTYVCDLMVTL